jgi:arsenate reductase
MAVTIYHNPRCSKCRGAMEILEEKGIETEVVEYLKTPPDKVTLEQLLIMLKMEPRELMRKGEPDYKQAGLDNPALTRDQLIEAMVQHPVLIERPIVVSNGKAVIGRPPDRIVDIL